jgi:hypothetical protein
VGVHTRSGDDYSGKEFTVDRDGQLYLGLLKKVLTNTVYQDVPH